MNDLIIYSPTEQIQHTLFQEKQVQVFIKRDDMIHPFISGNKWRKLKYNILAASTEGKKHLVTFGGAWSNHLLATACCTAKFGFKSTAFVRGEKTDNSLLSLCKMFGMELRFTDRTSYRDKQALFDNHFNGIPDAFFVDEGGAGSYGVKGCSELVDELQEHYDHLFCACGTGTTAAGIINGLRRKQFATQFSGVPVLKNGGFIRAEIEKHLESPADFVLHLDYHFGGYAKTPPELIEFMNTFSSSTGILLDPIYTGKLVFAVFDLIKKDYFKPGEKILIIHTGGLIGLLGKL